MEITIRLRIFSYSCSAVLRCCKEHAVEVLDLVGRSRVCVYTQISKFESAIVCCITVHTHVAQLGKPTTAVYTRVLARHDLMRDYGFLLDFTVLTY